MQRAVELLSEGNCMPSSPMSQEYTASLRVCNAHARPITLHLEPWGEQYTMPPEATFLVIARGPEGDALEVECAEDHIVLYGWPGAVVTLFHAAHLHLKVCKSLILLKIISGYKHCHSL
jgi:hypothetical protein